MSGAARGSGRSRGCWFHPQVGREPAQAPPGRSQVGLGQSSQKLRTTGRNRLTRGHQAPRNWPVCPASASGGAHGPALQVPQSIILPSLAELQMPSPGTLQADPRTTGPFLLSAVPMWVPTDDQQGYLQSELSSLPSPTEAPKAQSSLQEAWVAPLRHCLEVGY